MTVTAVLKDPETRTMTITAEFPHPCERVWELWADPRQLEQWWGPPSYPATVVDHDLTPGGTVTYFMTGPEGDQPRGWWRIESVEPPHRLVAVDGFADEHGVPNPDMPTTTFVVTITARPAGGSTMSIATEFASLEAMEQLVAMGMEEGITLAVGQIDAILAQ